MPILQCEPGFTVLSKRALTVLSISSSTTFSKRALTALSKRALTALYKRAHTALFEYENAVLFNPICPGGGGKNAPPPWYKTYFIGTLYLKNQQNGDVKIILLPPPEPSILAFHRI